MDNYDRKIVVAIGLILFFLLIGTMFYHYAEGWRFVDSFYFTGATLTTVGYGDFHPTHDYSKIVTVLFMFSGIGVVFYSISVIAQRTFQREEERLQRIIENAKARNAPLVPPMMPNHHKTLVKFEAVKKH
jgi:voltage-gated potassium channel